MTRQPVTSAWRMLPSPCNQLASTKRRYPSPYTQLPPPGRCSHGQATSCHHPEDAIRTGQPVAMAQEAGASRQLFSGNFRAVFLPAGHRQTRAGPRCPAPQEGCGKGRERGDGSRRWGWAASFPSHEARPTVDNQENKETMQKRAGREAEREERRGRLSPRSPPEPPRPLTPPRRPMASVSSRALRPLGRSR